MALPQLHYLYCGITISSGTHPYSSYGLTQQHNNFWAEIMN
jgi:hypothetical protein